MKLSHRFLAAGVAVLALQFASAAAAQDSNGFEVTLLGTGTLPPLTARFGPRTD